MQGRGAVRAARSGRPPWCGRRVPTAARRGAGRRARARALGRVQRAVAHHPTARGSRARARCAIRKRSSSSSTRDAASGTEADVREDVEMRERARTPGTGSPTPRRSGGTSIPSSVSSQDAAAEGDGAVTGPEQPGDDAQHRRLPGPRRADERRRGAVGDGQLDGGVEATKGMGEVEVERHRVRSLTESSVAALMITRMALIASATSKSMSNCS